MFTFCYYKSKFGNGNFPDKLILAEITPVFKKGDKFKISDYHFVSVFCNVSINFEKVDNFRLWKSVCDNNVFYFSQCGFRKGLYTGDEDYTFHKWGHRSQGSFTQHYWYFQWYLQKHRQRTVTYKEKARFIANCYYILGPLLFLLYKNYISHGKNFDLILFAKNILKIK